MTEALAISIDSNIRQEINPDFNSLRSELIEGERVTLAKQITALCCKVSVVLALNIMVGGGLFAAPLALAVVRWPFGWCTSLFWSF